MDPLSQLIANEVQRRLAETRPRVPYAVWIEGTGWLKSEQGRVFADMNREVAETAAELWGPGARVLPVDLPDGGQNALQVLETKFLQQQQDRRNRRWTARLLRAIRTWLISMR